MSLLPVGICPNLDTEKCHSEMFFTAAALRQESQCSHRLVITFTVAPCLLPLLLFSALALAGKHGLKANNTHKFHKRHAHEKTGRHLQQISILTLSIKMTLSTQSYGPRNSYGLGFHLYSITVFTFIIFLTCNRIACVFIYQQL